MWLCSVCWAGALHGARRKGNGPRRSGPGSESPVGAGPAAGSDMQYNSTPQCAVPGSKSARLRPAPYSYWRILNAACSLGLSQLPYIYFLFYAMHKIWSCIFHLSERTSLYYTTQCSWVRSTHQKKPWDQMEDDLKTLWVGDLEPHWYRIFLMNQPMICFVSRRDEGYVHSMFAATGQVFQFPNSRISICHGAGRKDENHREWRSHAFWLRRVPNERGKLQCTR